MRPFIYIIAVFSSFLLGAHFMRAGQYGLTTAAVIMPLLFFIRRRWVLNIVFGLLFLGTLEWLRTMISLYLIRQSSGEPATRMLIILGSVAVVTLLAALLLYHRKFKAKYYKTGRDSALAAVFLLTAFLMGIAHIKVKITILLLERFFPSFGWLEVFLLSLYAVWIADRMLDPMASSLWRRRIWAIFSIIFFAQLSLGLIGLEKFLMTGKLHLPVPAMIIAGPLFRGEITIMIFLFLGSIILLGPAWCSHLCYIGAWDDAFSRARRKPKKLPRWRQGPRFMILVLVIAAALGLKYLGVSTFAAGMIGLGFGLLGVGMMVFWSRRAGVMTHCVTFCPIGQLAVWLGKISPFRIRIKNECTDCGICRPACRYDALNMPDIKKRKPNINCTLCGDCLGKCEDRFIEYRFLGLKANQARTVFITLAVSLHTVFLATGRI